VAACFVLLTASVLIAWAAISAGHGTAPPTVRHRRATPAASRSTQAVPILIYHHVASAWSGPASLCVTPDEFARQLAYLRRHDYHPVNLQRVYDSWNGRASLPRNPIVLSFDDGYADQYRYAVAALRRYRWPAVLNLIVENTRGTLTSIKVRRMISWGWEIDSHTITHRDLTRLSATGLRRELVGSRDQLRRLLHVPVNFLCYPGGAYNARVRAAARAAGYLAATTISFGAATPKNLFALKRIAVWRAEPLGQFGGALRSALRHAHLAGLHGMSTGADG
jgi:peptidoglycan/xylan/chitin deacetylase (PgdA/CDA1 family)